MNFSRLKTYFFRGHNAWFVFPIWFVNAISIWYGLLFEEIPVSKVIFPNIFIFAFVFTMTYFPIAILVGWYDYKRGTYKVESRLISEENPFFAEMMGRLTRIEELLSRET